MRPPGEGCGTGSGKERTRQALRKLCQRARRRQDVLAALVANPYVSALYLIHLMFTTCSV